MAIRSACLYEAIGPQTPSSEPKLTGCQCWGFRSAWFLLTIPRTDNQHFDIRSRFRLVSRSRYGLRGRCDGHFTWAAGLAIFVTLREMFGETAYKSALADVPCGGLA